MTLTEFFRMNPTTAPRTKQEADAYRYAGWWGGPHAKVKAGLCAFGMVGPVYAIDRTYEVERQCCRAAGYGPDGLYCASHAAMIAERRASGALSSVA